jgi:hypothetical protein
MNVTQNQYQCRQGASRSASKICGPKTREGRAWIDFRDQNTGRPTFGRCCSHHAATLLGVVVVFGGLAGRFADIGIDCEVHDGSRPPYLEDPLEVFLVSEVALFRWSPLGRSFITPFKVVEARRHMTAPCHAWLQTNPAPPITRIVFTQFLAASAAIPRGHYDACSVCWKNPRGLPPRASS